MTSKLSLALASAAALILAGAAAAETTTETRTEIHKTAHVFVVDGKDAGIATDKPHQIVVTSRAVDGQEPSLQVKMLGLEGADGEAIDIGSLEPGETRTFTSASGKDVVVTRGDEGVTLSVDGKQIQLPSILGVSVSDPGARMAIVQAEGGSGTWTAAGETEDVIVLGGAPHAFLPSPMALAGNFEQLESVKDLDPEVREKVVAALKEIFAAHHGAHAFAFTTQAPAPGDAAAAPGQRVMVRRVVVDSKDDAKVE